MAPYFLVLIIIVIVALISQKYKRKVVIFDYIIILILVIFSSIRYLVGTDYSLYFNLYNTISIVGPVEAVKNNGVEIGYSFFNYVISLIFDNQYAIFFGVSVVVISITIIFIKKNSENYYVSIIFYYCFSFFTNSLNIQRQYIAASILLVAVHCLSKRKVKTAIIFIIIASLFHRTVLIFLVVVYFLDKIKITYKIFIGLIAIGVMANISYDSILSFIPKIFGKYVIYEEQVYKPGMGTYLSVIFFLLMSLIMIYLSNKNKYEYRVSCYIKIILLGIPFYFLSLKSFLLIRIAMVYFGFYNIVLLPEIFRCLRKNVRLNVYYYYTIAMLIWFMIYLITQNGVVPYKTYFTL